jgi:hypothetical protein
MTIGSNQFYLYLILFFFFVAFIDSSVFIATFFSTFFNAEKDAFLG